MDDLSGKVVLVTGGSRGIGAGIVRGLHAAGAHVILHYSSSREQARAIAAELGRERCLVLGADLDHPAEAVKLWSDSLAWKGRVDVLVNNAATRPGIGMDADPLAWAAVWERTLRVNLVATALLCKAAIPHFKTLGTGTIINITSRPAFRGDRPDFFHDGASKGGMVSLTRGIARFYGKDNVLAYLVVPGLIETEQLAEYKKRYSIAEGLAEIPLGALGTPQDIAEWVVFLSTGRARYATGATIDVGGASYMH